MIRKLTISESQRNRIQAMLARGLSRYRISKETGIGKYHLRKILKESNAVSAAETAFQANLDANIAATMGVLTTI